MNLFSQPRFVRQIVPNSLKFMIEVAVLGGAINASILSGTIEDYKKDALENYENTKDTKFDPNTPKLKYLPQGGEVAKWLSRRIDGSALLLHNDYFYAGDKSKKDAIVLNVDNLGSWRTKRSEAFKHVWDVDLRPTIKQDALSTLEIVFNSLSHKFVPEKHSNFMENLKILNDI